MTYLQQLQKAIDYIELNLQEEVDLRSAIKASCYSRSHFIWVFKEATGYTPVEYVRKRRLTESAREIIQGEKIAPIVYKYSFSSQDVFTRCFKNEFSVTPGKVASASWIHAKFTPKLRLYSKGGFSMRLKKRIAGYSGKKKIMAESFLSEEVLKLIGDIAITPKKVSEIDKEVFSELEQMGVLRIDNEFIKLNTSVFIKEDLENLKEAMERISSDLAKIIIDNGRNVSDKEPLFKSYVCGVCGLGKVFNSLKKNDLLYDWKEREGKYAKTFITFDEITDDYINLGPDHYIINITSGDEYKAVVIGDNDENYLSYIKEILSGASDEKSYSFASSMTSYMTDSFGKLLRGQISDKNLISVAEKANLHIKDKTKTCFMEDSKKYTPLLDNYEKSMDDYISKQSTYIKTLLESTSAGRQGVCASKLSLNFVRYLRKLTIKKLYEQKFLNDTIPIVGSGTIFFKKDDPILNL